VKIVFVDAETTSLRPDRRAWEVAIIERDTLTGKDTEHTWFVMPEQCDLGNADLNSLRIGHFYERHPTVNGTDRGWSDQVVAEYTVAVEVERLTRGAIWVGAVPDFDTHVLGEMLRRNDLLPAWHYHLVDVETLAAGAMKLAPPWDFKVVLDAYGLAYADEKDRHTALGDARMVRDLYDAVLTGAPRPEVIGG